MSVIVSTPDLTDPAVARSFAAVADAAESADGYAPFNEQSLLDLAAGRRKLRLIHAPGDATGTANDTVVGAAIVGNGELDLVVLPGFRGRGYGGDALAELLPATDGSLTAWSHGDFPAARALAERFGFEAVRRLLQLRLDPLPPARHPAAHPGDAPSPSPAAYELRPFRPGVDDDEWVSLNARIFAAHPEQGRMTRSDLAARQAEPWFDAGDFLLTRDRSGRMSGFIWLKITPTDGVAEVVGEVYVLGVAPEAAGAGLGRALLSAGLDRLRNRGCRAASLYVEADNTAALSLYRSFGFSDHTIDVQYRSENR